jgi:hypothetical protein
MGRYKTLIGPRLRVRGFAAQQTEAAIDVAVLNRMLVAGYRITAWGWRHLALRLEGQRNGAPNRGSHLIEGECSGTLRMHIPRPGPLAPHRGDELGQRTVPNLLMTPHEPD